MYNQRTLAYETARKFQDLLEVKAMDNESCKKGHFKLVVLSILVMYWNTCTIFFDTYQTH